MPTMTEERLIDAVSDLVLLTLLENEERGMRGLAGITRLQKLVFLLSQSPEYVELVRTGLAPEVRFHPYRMGPFTPEIYQAIDVLADFRPSLISADRGTRERVDDVELDRYIDEVDLDRSEPAVTTDPRPTTFKLTDPGRRVARALAESAPQPLMHALRRVISEYGGLSLTELLRRVYTAYPKMTERSEIRSQLGLG
jgi:hypothetical protein